VFKLAELNPSLVGEVHQFLSRLELAQLKEEILDQGDFTKLGIGGS